MEKLGKSMFLPGNGENDNINNIGRWRSHFHRRSEAVAFVMDPEKFELDFDSTVLFYAYHECMEHPTIITYLKTTWFGFLDSIAWMSR